MAPSDHQLPDMPDLVEDLSRDLDEPSMFRVILHNDNYTTMEFVILVLESVFHKSAAEATRIMLQVHKSGSGECGIYPFEIAETRVVRVQRLAEENGFPLLCTMEEI